MKSSDSFIKRQTIKSKILLVAMVSSLVAMVAAPALAGTTASYNFNSDGSLAAEFNSYTRSGSAVQSATGGIQNSGAIYAASSADAVFATKSSYSMGPVNSSYTFTAFLKSVGNSGYSGVGFTAATPASGTTGGSPFRSNDALGISVHGGGFVLHNGGATDVNGSWDSGGAGITTVKASTISDLLNSGSPDKWYKIIFKLVRVGETKFDTRIEVWSALSDGSLIRPSADAIFEWNNITNSALTTAPSIYSYINFSGYRVEYFDNYQVTLGGGASVIQPGAPVVLTDSTTENTGVVDFQGRVTSDGGSTVVERGFVYADETDPSVNDNKVPVGSGTGVFTGETEALPNGTYHFRAYATSANGTSYGTENVVEVTNSTATGSSPTPSPSDSASATPSDSASPSPSASASASVVAVAATSDLPKTGFYDDPRRAFAVMFVVLGAMFIYTVRIDLLNALYYDQPWLRYDKNYNLKRAIWSTKHPLK